MSKTYSTTIEITEEKEYSVTINTGLNLSAWISAGSTTGYPLNPSSYANFAALEADEKAIRQLMLVHNAVDYLATASAGDSLMQSVINSNICAKWINISDYAYDTLSANANIKSVMDTADKYGYGEWGKINSTTWGPLGNVPIMTANNAPYGKVIYSTLYNSSAYPAIAPFDADLTNCTTPATSDTLGVAYIGYQFVNPVCVKRFHFKLRQESVASIKLVGSNDDFNTSTDLGIYTVTSLDHIFEVNNSNYYLSYKIVYMSLKAGKSIGGIELSQLQFYGRELTGLIPALTSNTTPSGYGAIISDGAVNSSYPEWHAYDGNDSTAYSGIREETAYIGWDFLKKTKADFVYISEARIGTAYIEGSNNNNTWTTLATLYDSSPSTATKHYWFDIEGSEYRYYRLRATNGAYANLMFNVLQFYDFDYSEKEFAQGSTRKTIYDHGVVPSGAITGGTKNPDCLTLSAVGTATITINKGTRKYMGGKAGLHASGTNRLKCGSGYSNFTASNMPDSNGLDISSISGSVAVGIEQTASGTFDCTEIWLE